MAQVVSEREPREHPKRETEDGELGKLEVRCDPHLSRWNMILTPSQKEKKRKELEREEEGSNVRERKGEVEVRCDPHLF